MKFAILGCILVAMMSGCINHKNLILDNEWDSLKVGCLVFNGTTYEKRIITIDDHKFLSNLKKKFKPSSWSLSLLGVAPRWNRLFLYLKDSQTIEMSFFYNIPSYNLAVEAQDKWTFRARVSQDFENDLLQYLEKRTKSKIKFHLSCSEERQYPPSWRWGYNFYDIDFGHGKFCILFGDIKQYNKIPAIRDSFAFEPIMNNSYPYLDRFLSKYKPYTQRLNYSNCFKVYYKKGSGYFSLNLSEEKRKYGGFQKSHFALLVKEVIRKKAILIIFSGEKTKIFERTPPLTVCHSEKELFNILEHQYMTKGSPYVIFIPKNSTQLKK